VLASLGLENISLRTISGWRDVLFNKPAKGLYVCVEIGADFRDDVTWFLKHFSPHGVCVTGVDLEVWGRDPVTLIEEKKVLISAVPAEGFVMYAADNTLRTVFDEINISCQKIRVPASPAEELVSADVLLTPTAVDFDVAGDPVSLVFSRHLFRPQHKAVSFALACMQFVSPEKGVPEDFFAEYTFTAQRLNVKCISENSYCILDTYKAVPYCTEWFLSLGQIISASKKIVVLSELRPAPKNIEQHYARIATLLDQFDDVYFVGPKETYELLHAYAPEVAFISSPVEYSETAKRIHASLQDRGILFLKGSYTYHLDELFTQVLDLSKKK
jgi:UDP-N-acetylmuramyl pentapeptide synthase